MPNDMPEDQGDYSYADWVAAGKPGLSYDDWRWWNTGDTSQRKSEGDTHSPEWMRAHGNDPNAQGNRPNVTPMDPFDVFKAYLKGGKDEAGGAYDINQYGADVKREVARRRGMMLRNNPGLDLAVAGNDSLDAKLRNVATGRINRVRGNSMAGLLGQAFNPTAPLGRDLLLGDY